MVMVDLTDSLAPILNKWLMGRLTAAAQLIADDRVNDIKESISTECPTEYSTGKAAAHSPPGAPPYRETGLLEEGISATVENRLPEEIDIVVVSRRAVRGRVPTYLEFGTPKMAPRPYMGPGRNRAILRVPEILQHVCGGGV